MVLAEKPLISEETDLIEPTLLDELICHIASLASVYHKPPTAFVEGKVGLKRVLPARAEGAPEEPTAQVKQFKTFIPSFQTSSSGQVIPEPSTLIGDLLSMDIGGEYAERIDNANELLESFLDNFHDENSQVQLQLLTSIVKLFLKRPTDTQELVQQVASNLI